MKKNVLPCLLMLALFASCSSAYKTTQTPDDVYYSPGKTKEYAAVKKEDNNDSYTRRQQQSEDVYQDYTSSSEDNYLRMKIGNRYQWNTIDDYDYWNSPNYAYNNYYGFNSFNPYTLNTWGLNYYYSPFASIQPYSWFNSYYPSYGYNSGYSSFGGSYYGQGYGYGYYGYSPVNEVVNTTNRTHTYRPLLGSYVNNNYNNSNNTNNRNGRYVLPSGNGVNRYNNSNNSGRNNNNNSVRFNNNNTNTSTNNSYTPSRSYTPSSSGSSGSSSGGTVARPGRH